MPADTPGVEHWPLQDDIDFATEPDGESMEYEPAPDEPARRPAFALLADADLETVEPPEYQIDGTIVAESNVFIFGPPAVGKSFLAIEYGRAIAARRPAFGARTVHGSVVYIAAEGGRRGMAKRCRAWNTVRNDGELVDDFWVVAQPVSMLDPAVVRRFVGDVRARVGEHVGLFVIDTLARCTGGGDENSAGDMGAYVASCDLLRSTFGATVMTVHHSGKTADSGMRGSSALHGAADTEIKVSRDPSNGLITAAVVKQKDGDIPPPLRLQLEVVPEHASCVLRRADGVPEPAPDALDKRSVRACLDALSDLGAPATHAEWYGASGMSNGTFGRARSELLRYRAVEAVGNRYRVVPESERRT